MSNTIAAPTRDEVSQANKEIFDKLQEAVGFVPNLYASYAHNETALGDYLALQNRKTTLSNKEKEVVNLVVSQVNECQYCLSAHTTIGKMNGFTEDEILEVRSGQASFNPKLDALSKFTKNITENRGKPSELALQSFFQAGYTKANLIDTLILIGDKTISNFVHGATQVEIDFPLAPALELQEA